MLRKHSVSIRGHRTSFSLEDEFMARLRMLAAREGVSLTRVIERVDSTRADGVNLSSALRLHVLNTLIDASADERAAHPTPK